MDQVGGRQRERVCSLTRTSIRLERACPAPSSQPRRVFRVSSPAPARHSPRRLTPTTNRDYGVWPPTLHRQIPLPQLLNAAANCLNDKFAGTKILEGKDAQPEKLRKYIAAAGLKPFGWVNCSIDSQCGVSFCCQRAYARTRARSRTRPSRMVLSRNTCPLYIHPLACELGAASWLDTWGYRGRCTSSRPLRRQQRLCATPTPTPTHSITCVRARQLKRRWQRAVAPNAHAPLHIHTHKSTNKNKQTKTRTYLYAHAHVHAHAAFEG